MIQETVFTFSPEMLVALLKGQEIRIEQTPGTWMIFRIEPEMDLESVVAWVKEK